MNRRLFTIMTFVLVLNTGKIINAQSCNPVAEYDFNGNVNDVSGNNLHGTNNGATLTTDRNGNPNQAYSFNGTSSFLELNNNNAVITNTSFSIETWAKMDGPAGGNGNNMVFVQRTDPTSSGNVMSFRLENTSGNMAFGGRGDAGSSGQEIQYPSQGYGTYHHYVAVLDYNMMYLYVDGIQVASAPYVPNGNFDTNIDYVHVGKNRYSMADHDFFNGVIDFVNIYNCALSPSEVSNLYNGACNPVAEYDFNGNVNDVSGNNLHGTNNGATLTTDRLGNPNQAYSFNGTSSFLELNNNNAVITNTSFSIETWAKMDGVGGGNGNNMLFVQRTDPTSSGNVMSFRLENTSGNMAFGGRGDAGSSGQEIQYPSQGYGTYHHYVAVLDYNMMYLYVDGIQVASAPYVPNGNFDTNIDYVHVGKNRYSMADHDFFNGVIDFVNIYNCALDSTEILDLATVSINEHEYENSLIQIYPNPTNGIITLTDVENKGIEKISVYDISGKMVPFNSYNNMINLSSVSQGVYFLNVEFKDGSQTVSKFIVE